MVLNTFSIKEYLKTNPELGFGVVVVIFGVNVESVVLLSVVNLVTGGVGCFLVEGVFIFVVGRSVVISDLL